MIIDNLCVFSDGEAVAEGNSRVIGVMPFLGRGEPVHISLLVTDDVNNLDALSVSLQQSDSRDGTFADTGAGLRLSLAELKSPNAFRLRLPDNAIKPYLRLNYAIEGTAPSTGTIFAALSRDVQLNYLRGQYLDKGRPAA